MDSQRVVVFGDVPEKRTGKEAGNRENGQFKKWGKCVKLYPVKEERSGTAWKNKKRSQGKQ